MFSEFLILLREKYPIVIQIIGFVAMGIGVFSFTRNSKKTINLVQVIAGVLFSLHFFLLGEKAGCLLNALAAVRATVYCHTESKIMTDKRLNVGFLILFMVLCLTAGILTWDRELGWKGALPAVAMILSTVGLWIKNPTIIRCVNLPASPCWLIYNVTVQSWAGVVTEILNSLTILISAVRYDIIPFVRKKKEQEKSAEE